MKNHLVVAGGLILALIVFLKIVFGMASSEANLPSWEEKEIPVKEVYRVQYQSLDHPPQLPLDKVIASKRIEELGAVVYWTKAGVFVILSRQLNSAEKLQVEQEIINLKSGK